MTTPTDDGLPPASQPDDEPIGEITAPTGADGRGSAHEPRAADVLVPEPRPSLPGELLAGKYHLLAALGRGGMASVYLGVASGPAGFNKLVVIKRLHDVNAGDPSFVTMFLDEARLSARLNHPNIVHTYEVGEANDSYLLVMEYLEGQSFARLARAMKLRGERCDVALAAHLMAEAMQGLHYAHEMRDYDGSPLGIVHRDVSPHNLFVTYEGQIKVLDFGVAKATLNAANTHDGVLKGKFGYMAPEMPSGGKIDRRTDIFAAGVVLWELLTGERLFPGDTVATLSQVMNAAIKSPSSLNPAVPPELDAIVHKALERSAESRFATAREMSAELLDFLAGAGKQVRREDIARRMQELFADVRQTIAQTIQMHMASRPKDSMRASQASLLRPSIPPLPPLPSIPTPPIPTPAPSPPAGATLTRVPSKTPAPVWLPFAAVAAIAGFAGVGGALLVRQRPLPSVASDILHVRPEVEESFHLTLGSDPLEAQVEWGGKVVGQTPMLIDLLTGPQTFVLSHEGYVNATVVVNVTDAMAGRTESRTVVLTARPKEARGSAETGAARAVTGSSGAQPSGGLGDARRVGAEASRHRPAARPEPSATAVATPQPAMAIAPPAEPTVLPFGPEMTRPTFISGADLVYTREAIVTGASGTMIAKCTITAEGTLRNCRIIKGLPYLDKAMLDSLATRRYTPVTYQGKPVSVEYIFNLRIPAP